MRFSLICLWFIENAACWSLMAWGWFVVLIWFYFAPRLDNSWCLIKLSWSELNPSPRPSVDTTVSSYPVSLCPQGGPGLQVGLGAGEPPPARQRFPRWGAEGRLPVSRLHLPETQVLGKECGGGASGHHHPGAPQVSTASYWGKLGDTGTRQWNTKVRHHRNNQSSQNVFLPFF